jgi:hypothetical protein
MFLLLFAFAGGCKKITESGGIINPCPVVASTDPTDKAVDVLLNKVISATFNTAMNPSTINRATFTIQQGTLQISGTIAPTANAAQFTFTPDIALLPFTTYKGTITTGAADKFRTTMVADYVFTFTTIPKLSISSTPTAGGTTTGAGLFAQGSKVTVNAIPNTGYTFANWTDSGSTTVASTSPSYQFTMAGNRALVANFTVIPPTQNAVVLASNPIAGGSTYGSGSYNTGSSVTIIESPNPGYTFVNWTENGVQVSTNSSYQFPLTSNKSFVANFSLIPALQYALLLSSNPIEGGTTTGAGSYTSGASVTINATPSIGFTFVNWTENGAQVSTSPTYVFPITSNRTLIANFAINKYTLSTIIMPSNGGTVLKNPDQPTYNYGSFVSVIAAPLAGFSFLNWTENGTIVSTNATYSFLITSNRTLIANFALQSSPAVPMGTAANFGAMGGSAGITNQGINTVINNGGIATTGVSTTVTGFHDITGDKYIETPLNIGNVTGRIYTDAPPPVIFGPGGPYGGNAITKAIADQALLDATAAYQSISPASKPGGTDPGAGELGGLSLAPGTYKAAGGTFKITLLDLELDAKGDPNAVWIFQTASSLTVGNPSAPRSITFKSGVGSPKNVFWYVGSTAVINYAGGGTMVGTIIANSGVTLSSPANSTNNVVQTVLNGRALSLVSSVTMVNTVINNQ